jgi:hypothetical protein
LECIQKVDKKAPVPEQEPEKAKKSSKKPAKMAKTEVVAPAPDIAEELGTDAAQVEQEIEGMLEASEVRKQVSLCCIYIFSSNTIQSFALTLVFTLR